MVKNLPVFRGMPKVYDTTSDGVRNGAPHSHPHSLGWVPASFHCDAVPGGRLHGWFSPLHLPCLPNVTGLVDASLPQPVVIPLM